MMLASWTIKQFKIKMWKFDYVNQSIWSRLNKYELSNSRDDQTNFYERIN